MITKTGIYLFKSEEKFNATYPEANSMYSTVFIKTVQY